MGAFCRSEIGDWVAIKADRSVLETMVFELVRRKRAPAGIVRQRIVGCRSPFTNKFGEHGAGGRHLTRQLELQPNLHTPVGFDRHPIHDLTSAKSSHSCKKIELGGRLIAEQHIAHLAQFLWYSYCNSPQEPGVIHR